MERQLKDVVELNKANNSNNNTVSSAAVVNNHEAGIDLDIDGSLDIDMGFEAEAMRDPHIMVPEEWTSAISFPNRLRDVSPGAFVTPLSVPSIPVMQTEQSHIRPAPVLTLLPHRPTIVHLPSKSCALILINQTFESFNRYFPLFDQTSFLRSFHAKYSPDASFDDDPTWWASINVVFALGYLFRAMRTLDRHENDLACSYTQNALWVVAELIALPRSLPAIQSLLGIAIALEGTPHSQLCSVVIATAMRLAHAMQLHRRTEDQTLTAAEIEERRNVFWIAYCMDRNIAYLNRQPSLQDDDDIDVELPAGIISQPLLFDDDHRPGARTSINLFNSRIALAIIQGQIYKRLYSVRAARETPAQRAVAAAHLDAILACWRTSVPFEFGRNTVTALEIPIDECILHTIILRLVYVECLITVRRHMQPETDSATAASGAYVLPQTPPAQATLENVCATIHRHLPGEPDDLPRCPLSGSQRSTLVEAENLCLSESREAVKLIQKLPKGDYACVWLIMNHLCAAVTVLLENIIRDPAANLARSDFALVEPFLQLLEDLAGRQHSADAPRLNESCKELSKRARYAIDSISVYSNTDQTAEYNADGPGILDML
ncbi:hypothetical protein TWF696_001966 [Orbilia brochopaga]